MIAQTVEYALRAVIHLAYRAPGAQTTEQLATATLVPKAYLSKVLQGLVAQGIVSSRRGVGGGMTLALDRVDKAEPTIEGRAIHARGMRSDPIVLSA